MSIIKASNKNIRADVIEYVKNLKKKNPNATIIDVGGYGNPWLDEYVDAYVDVVNVNTTKKVFIGDINLNNTWNELSKEDKFDFSICTHTLEDIRCPEVALEGLQKISKAGFIAVPNKHTEFSHIESSYFVGYAHHRWIFTLQNNELRMIGKFPLSNYFSNRNGLILFLSKFPFIRRIYCKALRIKPTPGLPYLSWFEKKLAKHSYELGFIWEDSFKSSFINNDFTGFSSIELGKLYSEQLAAGL